MNRSNPVGSLISLVGFVLLLAMMAMSYARNGGQLFSPGPLTSISLPGVLLGGFASHSEFIAHCELCHRPFVTIQSELCMNCHTDIEAETNAQTGIHGHVPSTERCMDCHSDHKGEDFNPSKAALAFFDHATVHFDLLHHQVGYDQAPMPCGDCHIQNGSVYQFQSVSCEQCHAKKDEAFMRQHIGDFGPDCLDCHDGKDRMKDFDHAKTNFPLQGKHVDVPCVGCHEPGQNRTQFKGLPGNCQDCHVEPDKHRGEFVVTCAECHDPSGWIPARLNGVSFDHLVQTGFSLELHRKDYSASSLSCKNCHLNDLNAFNSQVCVACHRQADAAFMDQHVTTYGLVCMGCHDGVDRMHDFDHNKFFLLDGKHAEIQCSDCHGIDPQTARYIGTPKECSNCHAEPQIHAGFFGLHCQGCHSTMAWQPAFLQSHMFPLDHGGTAVACEVCHTKTYAEYTCFSCHDHQPDETVSQHEDLKLSASDLKNCAHCHPDGKEEN